MLKSIDITDNLYVRLGHHAKAFETPSSVIERLLDVYEATKYDDISSHKQGVNSEQPLKLEPKFIPDNPDIFKSMLLQNRKAYIRLEFQDGTSQVREWTANRFNENSDVLGNLRSGYLRDWRKKGIVEATVAIEKKDLTELDVRCLGCNKSHIYSCSDLSWESGNGGGERQMGPESQYEAIIEDQCECGNDMSIKFECWEYPVGVVNKENTILEGVEIIENKCETCPELHSECD
jgi:hypothetical protein